MNTYKQFPIVLERGNGTYLWDVNNKKYLEKVSLAPDYSQFIVVDYYNNKSVFHLQYYYQCYECNIVDKYRIYQK